MSEKINCENDKIKKFQYSSFNDISDVADIFDCEIEYQTFIKEKKYNLDDVLKEFILGNFKDRTSYQNEYVICERLISPIITLLSKNNNIKVWSHKKYDVKVNNQLEFIGTPDYLWGIPTAKGSINFSKTVACLGEAKQDNFIKGWAQVGAEMIATQYNNNNFKLPVFGLVSNGTSWEFGKLVNKTFIIDELGYKIPANLENVLDSLNWFLCEVRKNADILEEIVKQEKASNKEYLKRN